MGQIQLAGMLLGELVTLAAGWKGPWVEERKQVTLFTFLRSLMLTDIPVDSGFTQRVSESGEASRVHVRGKRVGHVRVDLGSRRPSLVSVHSI